MPRVNAGFRTLTGPQNTSAMGSSMGGLLSYYLVKEHPDAFGACGCVSTHFPVSDAVLGYGDDTTPYVVTDIANGDRMPDGARLFFDHGTESLDAEYGPTHAKVRDWLLGQGLTEGEDFRIKAYQGAGHNEAAWRSHLDEQLVWLLGTQ
jgi:enterochelin esterase-like enzyme